MDRQWVSADSVCTDPAGRVAGRPLRATESAGVGCHSVCRGVRAVWSRANASGLDRRPRNPGRWRCAPDTQQPGHHPGKLSPRRSRSGHRLVVRPGRDRLRGRSVSGRLAGRVRVVALDLLHQRPGGAGSGVRRAAACPRNLGPGSYRADRLARRRPGRTRAGWHHLRRCGMAESRPDRAAAACRDDWYRREPGVCVSRDAYARANAAARHFRVAPVQRGESGHVRHVRCADRR